MIPLYLRIRIDLDQKIKDGRKTIVQCKRWNAFKVNVSMVREAYGVMVAEGAEKCIFVASGKYTRDAKLFAKGKPIQLIEGQDLLKLIQGIKAPPKYRRQRWKRSPLPLHVPIAGATWLAALPVGARLRVADSGVALDTQPVSESRRYEVVARITWA